MSFSDLNKKLEKSKPESRKDIDLTEYIGFVDRDEPENIMYDLSVDRLKREKILGDKDMDKKEIINWFISFISKNKKQFTLDWLRGQKLTFECVNEIRKNK